MKDRSFRPMLFLLIGCFLALILLIVFAAVSTGGKDFSEFNETDRSRLVICAMAAIPLLFLVFFAAAHLGQLLHPNGKEELKAKQETMPLQELSGRRNGLLLTILSLLGALLLSFLVRYLPGIPEIGQPVLIAVLFISVFLPPVILLASVLLKSRYVARINEKRVDEMSEFLQKKREEAEADLQNANATFRRYRLISIVVAVILAASGVLVVISATLLPLRVLFLLLVIYATCLLILGFSRLIRFRVSDVREKDIASILPREVAPGLYEIVEEEAKKAGIGEKIRISFSAENAGVSLFKNTVILDINLPLLRFFTEQEFRAIIRHEFAHVIVGKKDREMAYIQEIGDARPVHIFRKIEALIYGYTDTACFFESSVNAFSRSVMRELKADEAMSEGTPEAAVSALMKVYFKEKAEYERAIESVSELFREDAPPKQELSEAAERFQRVTALRAPFWTALLDKEILSRTATHPTLKMRLDALGAASRAILPAEEGTQYVENVQNALAFADAFYYEKRLETYEEDRETYYLKHLRRIDEWKEQGEPVTEAGEFTDVLDSLESLGRYEEANALADQVIREIPMASYPYLIKGFNLLRSYDDAGIELLYQSAESDPNNREFALDEIGRYCCETGNRAELERYRETAVTLLQKQKDVYSETCILRKTDRLLKETLPEGQLEKDIAHILSLQQQEILTIYLVKKVISDDDFVSAYVIRFRDDVPEDRRNEIMHGIFLYLDQSTTWHYALFLYDHVAPVGIEKIAGSLVYSAE